MSQYRVTAKHDCPEFGCTDLICEPKPSAGTDKFYVSIPGYGCSKDYDTPVDAIRGMLRDHGCFNIRIELV